LYKKLSPQEYLELKNKDMNWQLLDVREPWEIEIANISGSLNIPINEINVRMNEIDKNHSIAVICHSGIRSAKVADILLENSFHNVANIEGGIHEWAENLDQSVLENCPMKHEDTKKTLYKFLND
jgi:rhodanese-related sulfurtransferase|tara:strand:+ start:8657 stop:9031 length:375 start_codon:yes stop_codon:yes gene_type:complete